ncbi:MAG: hypothetical protein U0572_14340 [Phycisphaerales bacterium]
MWLLDLAIAYLVAIAVVTLAVSYSELLLRRPGLPIVLKLFPAIAVGFLATVVVAVAPALWGTAWSASQEQFFTIGPEARRGRFDELTQDSGLVRVVSESGLLAERQLVSRVENARSFPDIDIDAQPTREADLEIPIELLDPKRSDRRFIYWRRGWPFRAFSAEAADSAHVAWTEVDRAMRGGIILGDPPTIEVAEVVAFAPLASGVALDTLLYGAAFVFACLAIDASGVRGYLRQRSHRCERCGHPTAASPYPECGHE